MLVPTRKRATLPGIHLKAGIGVCTSPLRFPTMPMPLVARASSSSWNGKPKMLTLCAEVAVLTLVSGASASVKAPLARLRARIVWTKRRMVRTTCGGTPLPRTRRKCCWAAQQSSPSTCLTRLVGGRVQSPRRNRERPNSSRTRCSDGSLTSMLRKDLIARS